MVWVTLCSCDLLRAMEAATDTSQADKKPFTDRGEFLASLHQKGGFVLNCETVVTLHKISAQGQSWDVMDYGILAILSTEEELSLVIGDIDSGELVHVFALNTSSKYTIHKDHFHTFSGEDGSLQGMSFSEISVGRKVSRVVSQLLPQESEEGGVPPAKRPKQGKDYDEWVVINKEDVPVVLGDREAAAVPDSTQSGDVGGEEGGEEETDFSLFGKRKEKKPELKIEEISGPSYFRHISHVGSEAPTETAVLEASCKTEGEEKKGTFERATKRSTSFEFESSSQMETEVSTARPTSEVVSSSSFISTSSGSSFSMPEPPPYLDDHEALLFQINTFDRRSLHHVSDEEIKKSKNQPDSQRKRSLTSMFQSGFNLLMPKLQAMRQFSVVATISSTGEEEGFDDFDGQLFE